MIICIVGNKNGKEQMLYSVILLTTFEAQWQVAFMDMKLIVFSYILRSPGDSFTKQART